LLEQCPSLQRHFPRQNRLSEEPFSCQDMLRLFFRDVANANLLLSAKAREKAWRVVGKAWQKGIISSWTMEDMHQWVNDVLVPANVRGAIQRWQEGKLQTDMRQLWMQPDDIDAATLLGQQSAFDEALHELNQMVGLDELKQSIATLARRMRFSVERRQLGLPVSDMATYHAIFTGNPGTGKTTVARLLGKIYHSLGLLSRGEVICADRTTMLGRYIGETEENMKHLLEEARGNVLFVDEAYTLYNKNDDKDFGRHAVEALLGALARHNPDMLIVFAGYQKEMDKLMQMNPGLAGRFPYKFHFPDYDAQQLMQMVERVLQRDSYELSDDARMMLMQGITLTVQNRSETFANARWAEQLAMNGMIPAMADRIMAAPHIYDRSAYQRVEAVDVEVALQRFGIKSSTTRQRRVIGFCA
jgi:SpoVK/Ycf46/Vps4 family AAA+-type ATPase